MNHVLFRLHQIYGNDCLPIYSKIFIKTVQKRNIHSNTPNIYNFFVEMKILLLITIYLFVYEVGPEAAVFNINILFVCDARYDGIE